MTQRESTQEIEVYSKPEQELMLFEASLSGVVDEVVDRLSIYNFDLETDFRILWAEGKNANEIPPKHRTYRQSTLCHMTKVLPALRKSIGEGLITEKADAEDLAGSLMAFEGSPSACLRYLKGTSNSLVVEPIKPRELINILAAYQAILDVTLTEGDNKQPKPSLANVIMSAQDWGLDLKQSLSEVDVENVHASIEEYQFTRTISRASVEGEPYQTKHEINATSQRRNPIGFTAVCSDDFQSDIELENYMVSM